MNTKACITALAGMTSLFCSTLDARPLLTEEVPTVGRAAFEVGFSPSYRTDTFNEPENTYETVALPVHFAVGLHSRLDIGFELTSLSQRLERQNVRFKGSRTGFFSPYIKLSPASYWGAKVIWHTKLAEREQELPVGRGHDVEALVLFQLPSAWPLYFNLGYVFKDTYESKFGIASGSLFQVEPGNILEARAAAEVPLFWNMNFLLETAYYNVEKKTIGSETVPNSSGDVLDLITGLGWAYKGWNMNLGVGFGLLDENLTSFDLERGAGDVWTAFSLSYRLAPKKPTRY